MMRFRALLTSLLRLLPVLAALLICLAASAAQARELPPYVLDSSAPQGRITIYSEYYLDESGTLTLDDILATNQELPFTPAKHSVQQLGRPGNPVWIRLAIENRTGSTLHRFLELSPGTVALAEFYRPRPDGEFQRTISGMDTYPPWADLRSRNQLYRLSIRANTVNTYYFRIVPDSAFYYSLSLYDLEHYAERQLSDSAPFFLLLGTLLGLTLINLLAGIWLGNRENLIYAAFLASYILMMSASEGFIGMQFLPFPGMGFAVNNTFKLLTLITTIEFSRLFLQTRRHLPRLDIYLRLYLLCVLAAFPISLVLNSAQAAHLSGILSLLICVLLVVLMLSSLRHQVPRARFFLLTRSSQILIGMWILLASFQVTPFSHHFHLLLLASVSLEAILITMGTTYFHIRKISRDSIEQHQQELQQIRQQTRSSVLSRLNHEVRTPMSGILGMAELLNDSALTPNQRESIRSIRVAGENLLHTINNILDYSELNSDGSDINREAFRPEEALMEVFEAFREKSWEKDIKLISQPQPNAPALLDGDPIRFKQILSNILSDCFRQGETGELVVSLSSDYLNRDHIRLEIQGSTLAHSHLQPDTLTDDNSQPSLANARRICRQLRGDLGIRETRLQQNIIWATLPFRILADQPELETRDNLSLHNTHLLIIDDSQTVPKLIRQHASHWGMRVAHCRTSREALASLRLQMTLNDPYDLVIIDDQLPGFSNDQLATRILDQMSPARQAGLILLTSTREEAIYPSLATIAHETLAKPISTYRLQQALIRALENRNQPYIAPTPPPQELPEGLKILVAEDHHLSQRVIRGMLNKLGIDAHIVGNGLAALGAVQESDYDLVLMDCEMPEMDGFEAARQIRAREQRLKLTPMPIIALTAHVLKEHRDLSLAAGMDAHLAKPVELATLKQVILEHVTQHRHRA